MAPSKGIPYKWQDSLCNTVNTDSYCTSMGNLCLRLNGKSEIYRYLFYQLRKFVKVFIDIPCSVPKRSPLFPSLELLLLCCCCSCSCLFVVAAAAAVAAAAVAAAAVVCLLLLLLLQLLLCCCCCCSCSLVVVSCVSQICITGLLLPSQGDFYCTPVYRHLFISV